MATSNLLPPKERALIRFEEWRRIALFFTYAGFGILAFGSVVLLPSYLPLRSSERDLNRSRILEEESSSTLHVQETLDGLIREEKMLESFLGHAQGHSRASELLEYFLLHPTGITLTSLMLKKDGLVSIDGIAGTRQDLLALEGTLRTSGRFQDIRVPLSAIARRADIFFSLRGTLKPAYHLTSPAL